MTPPDHLTLSVVPRSQNELSMRPTQRDMAAKYFTHLAGLARSGAKSSVTQRIYEKKVNTWLAWLEFRGIDAPRPEDVVCWIGELRLGRENDADPVREDDADAPAVRKSTTLNQYRDSVSAFYAWAERGGFYFNITRSVRGLPVDKDEALECLSKEQVAGLIRLAQGDALTAKRLVALIELTFVTAVREVSICAANVGDLDLNTGTFVFRNKGSNDKSGRAQLGPSAIASMREYLARRSEFEGRELPKDAPLMASVGNRSGGQRFTDRAVRQIVSSLMQRAGHVQRGADGRIVRPGIFGMHSIRRSAITAVFEHAGLEAAQTLAHHKDPKVTTRAYVRANKAKSLQKSAAILDLGELLEAV